MIIVKNQELDRCAVEPLAGLTNEVGYVEVGLCEVWEGRLS